MLPDDQICAAQGDPRNHRNAASRYSAGELQNAGLRTPLGIENSDEAKRWNAYCEAENAKPKPEPVRWWTKFYHVFFAD